MIELLVLQKYLLRRLTDAKFAADVVWLESFLEASSISCLSRVTIDMPMFNPGTKNPSKRNILIVRCVGAHILLVLIKALLSPLNLES
jgi:hypothetical protein